MFTPKPSSKQKHMKTAQKHETENAVRDSSRESSIFHPKTQSLISKHPNSFQKFAYKFIYRNSTYFPISFRIKNNYYERSISEILHYYYWEIVSLLPEFNCTNKATAKSIPSCSCSPLGLVFSVFLPKVQLYVHIVFCLSNS